MWIKNYSQEDIISGSHQDPGDNSLLIQIVDPSDDFPTPLFPFKQVYQFKFGDFEDKDDYPDNLKCSDQQAEQIVAILQHAIDHQMNVIVHCFVGVCRSGAVVEVGVMMGFEESTRWRQPNLRVKHKLMKAAGLYPDYG
jgi:predicted protein tyrosine phosphatase